MEGPVDAVALSLETDGALRRTAGVVLTGERGEGGGMEPSTTGSALMLDIDCDFARRERAILM